MIINCPECGHEVSDKAEQCPKCGYPIYQQDTEPSSNNKNKKWLWIAIAAIVVVALSVGAWMLFKSDTNNDDDPNAVVELTPEFIEKVQQYDELAPFSEGRAAVCRDSLWGYINTKGDEVIPCQYSKEYGVGAEVFHEGMAQVYKDGKSYYINRKGEIAFEGKGGRFSEGVALLDNGNVVDKKGNVKFTVPNFYPTFYLMGGGVEYNLLPYFRNCRLYVRIADSDYCPVNSAFDINGNKIALEDGRNYDAEFYGEDNEYYGNYKIKEPERNYDEFLTGNDVGLVDKLGNYVIAAKYSEIGRRRPDDIIQDSIISNGVALVTLRENSCYYFENELSGMLEGVAGTYTPRFYAYADLKGNDTFSKKVLDHIAEADRIGRERRSNIRRQQEEAKRNASREVYITMSVENNDRGDLVDVSGNYSVRILPTNCYIATEKIKVPDGKVWVYEGVLEMGDAFMSPCAYSIDGSDNRAQIIWCGSQQVPSSYRDDGYFRKGRCGLPLNDRFAVQGGDYLTVKSMFGHNRGRHTIKVAFRELDRDYYREKCGYNF